MNGFLSGMKELGSSWVGSFQKIPVWTAMTPSTQDTITIIFGFVQTAIYIAAGVLLIMGIVKAINYSRKKSEGNLDKEIKPFTVFGLYFTLAAILILLQGIFRMCFEIAALANNG